MKLSAIHTALAALRSAGPQELEITGLHYDSRKVAPGGMFFALRGAAVDGHDFIEAALAAGAVAVVLERERALPPGVAAIQVADARLAMARVAATFYGDPTADIPVVGVTGTNGKTTVTYLVEAILRAAGKNPAVLGTINYRLGNQQRPSLHTTPESVDLLATIAEFRAAGADALVMEVSSHALEQRRVDGVRFDVGVFTNLTPEHLDYHGSMANYLASKQRFFTELLPGSSGREVLNLDDPQVAELAASLPAALTCGRHAAAAVRAEGVELSLQGIAATVITPAGALQLRSRLLGEFNLQNLLCAVAVGAALDLPLEVIAQGLAEAPQVPGRLEQVENQRQALMVVDYAHTPDALEKVLATLVALQPRRLLTVFGCGGDRDRTKRPVMGAIAARHSDLVVVTSDNPRTEQPLAIIEEIKAGVLTEIPQEWSLAEAAKGTGRGFVCLPDRREAIDFAVEQLQPGDLLLVAGKGHEDYQILGRERIHFDDREELRRALLRPRGRI
ncbi:MAG: UDP-N-acetylmuramoyl-L-alanyl-D-glutamate--2,6-diaminopimelate ligase [Trichloromonadaceae bacterium]